MPFSPEEYTEDELESVGINKDDAVRQAYDDLDDPDHDYIHESELERYWDEVGEVGYYGDR